MLASLEADGDPEQAAERIKIEEVIRTTEESLAQRDREISDLKELLEQQSAHLGSMAVGAAAVAEALNTDEIVQQERDNLQHLQEEWRAKLRQAEVDISVERAKLARERADLEETARRLRLEIETLRSPQRIEALAMRELRLVAPSHEDALIIERVVAVEPPGRTVVARR